MKVNQQKNVIRLEGKEIQVSNLNKTFWPKEGIIKYDLLDYYIKVAPVILPHIKDRPQSLLRFPNGITGKNFFQKDMDSLIPDWIESIKVFSEKEKTTNYMLCNDLPSLIFMINLGCIDINVWNSRADKLDYPDYLVIDLDPYEISFNMVIKTAQIAHRIFSDLKIKSYAKTSGATGMHIYIPTGAKYKYEQVRQLAEILVNLIHNESAEFTSIERMPQKRERKVYLDFLQNVRGQTMACPYCVRPREGAPVSTPLHWDEVIIGLKPEKFNIKNIFQRIEELGDIFYPVLEGDLNLKEILDSIGVYNKKTAE